MSFLFKIISISLGLTTAISILWVIIGSPLGIIVIILYLISKDQNKKIKYKKWIKLSFSGIALFLLASISYAIIIFIANLFGISLYNPLP